MIFETERLYLRKLTQDDFNDLCELLQDKDVMYAYEHDFTDRDVQGWLERQLNRYKTYEFGLWAIILKKTGEMVGQAGLTMQKCEGSEVLEIGYLLKKAYWHKGYASEAANGCKQYAFEKLEVNEVYSIIKVDNISSQKVAKNIDMKIKKEFMTQYYNGDMLNYLFEAEKPACHNK